MQKNADFRDSLERGRSKAVMEISNALYESPPGRKRKGANLLSKVQGPSELECKQKGRVGCRL